MRVARSAHLGIAAAVAVAALTVVPAALAVPFGDDFDSGDLSAWDRVVGSPEVTSATSHHGHYSLRLPRSSKPQFISHDYAPRATRVSLDFSYRHQRKGWLELMRFDNNGLRLDDDGRGRLVIRYSGRTIPVGAVKPSGNWNRVKIQFDAAGDRVRVIRNDRTSASWIKLPGLSAEGAVSFGARKASNGPLYLDSINRGPGAPPSLRAATPAQSPTPVATTPTPVATTPIPSGPVPGGITPGSAVTAPAFSTPATPATPVDTPPAPVAEPEPPATEPEPPATEPEPPATEPEPPATEPGPPVIEPEPPVADPENSGAASDDSAPSADEDSAPSVPPARLFGADSVWNAPLSPAAAIHHNSDGLVDELVRQVDDYGPWINTEDYSTPLYRAEAGAATETVQLTAPWGPSLQDAWSAVPIPADAQPAPGTDGHLTVWQPETDTLWEFWQAEKVNGNWRARWGGRVDNVSTSDGVIAPVGGEYWGATATSLPVIAGTVLIDEFEAGVIDHALALAIPEPKAEEFTWPALRTDGYVWSDVPEADQIPEGTRFRLPAEFDMSALDGAHPVTKMLAVAARDHGIVLRDKAGAVTFFGEDPSAHADNPYASIFEDGEIWNMAGDFPWSDLEALSPA